MARENQGLQAALIVFVILTMMLGVAAFLSVALVDYRRLSKESWWFYWTGVALLVLVLLLGVTIGGGKRWLNLLGFRFQPSEFTKPATIILLARLMSRPSVSLRNWKHLRRLFPPS